MRFPDWARHDGKSRMKFMCLCMSLHLSSSGQVSVLSEKAGVPYSTLRRAVSSGRMTYRVASRVATAAAGSGVRVTWLMAPEEIQINADGEVNE